MSKSLAFRCCGDRSTGSRNILETLEKDDKEEKKYSAEEKEVDEADLKKSVSERKKDIERRISQEQDKKREPQPVVMRRSESKERKDGKSVDLLSQSEKETCEEKSVSPEPANLTFDEKRLSFELGTLTKEKTDKKTELTQKLAETEKAVYQITGTESEPELSFQEKRLSFEKGLIKSVDEKPETLDTKTSKKIQMETIVSTESTPKAVTTERVISDVKETRLLEGVAKELTDFKEKEKIAAETQGIISPKVSTTPPPSPADVLKAKASEEWKSTPTSDTDGVHKASAPKPDDSFISKLLQQEFFKKSEQFEETPSDRAVSPLLTNVPPQNVLSDEKSFGNPFVDNESPTIFRRPHQATDFVLFDDEDWDVQDVVEFSSVTERAVPGRVPYVPEKFLEDSTKGELHQEKVDIFEKPLNAEKPVTEGMTFVTSALKDLNLPFVPLATVSQSPEEIVTETKTTITTVRNSDSPGEIIMTTVETERKFLPSHSQPFAFNDFSATSDAGDGDSIYECEMNFQKPEESLTVEESLKVIVDLSESCKTSSEDLVQNVDKSETENLVEIVDVTDEIIFENVAPQDLISNDSKADLLRRLDECIVTDFKPRSKNERKEINIPSEIKLDNTDVPFETSTVKPTTPTESNCTTDKIKSGPAQTSLANDSRNGRFLGAGGESISRLEDELTLLEQLEDQIRLLNEEEPQAVDPRPFADDVAKRIPTTEAQTPMDPPSITITQDETVSIEFSPPEETSNEDIVEAEIQAHVAASVQEPKDEPESKHEAVEEKSKKRKNRKRRSKKPKEDDVDTEEPSSPVQMDEQKRQFNVKPTNQPTTSQGKVEKNSEKEFQNMVSQLSVEEVDEAIQIWNEALNPLASQSPSEREEEQGPSSDQKSKFKEGKK